MSDRLSTRSARWRTAALTVIQIASVAYVVHSLYGERAELSHALDLSLEAFLALAILLLLAHVQRTFEFTYMLRRLGVKEPFVDGFWLTGAGYLLNHLPFNAGLIMRAALLKQDHALPYTAYLSLTMVNALVNVAVGALIGLGAAAGGYLGPNISSWTFAGLAAFASVPLGLISLPRSIAPSGKGFVARRIQSLIEGVVSIRGNGLGILILALLAGTRLAGAAARLWICFGALGASISLSSAALLGWGSVLFTLVNVTPGNLGLRELVLSLVAAKLGSSHTVSIAATSMDRVVLLAYIVAVGVPGLYLLRRRGVFKATPKPQTPAVF